MWCSCCLRNIIIQDFMNNATNPTRRRCTLSFTGRLSSIQFRLGRISANSGMEIWQQKGKHYTMCALKWFEGVNIKFKSKNCLVFFHISSSQGQWHSSCVSSIDYKTTERGFAFFWCTWHLSVIDLSQPLWIPYTMSAFVDSLPLPLSLLAALPIWLPIQSEKIQGKQSCTASHPI